MRCLTVVALVAGCSDVSGPVHEGEVADAAGDAVVDAATDAGSCADVSIWPDAAGADSRCAGPNPGGCVTTGCPAGMECAVVDACIPSYCDCSGLPGERMWVCSGDCGGGVCVEARERDAGGCK